MFVYATGLDTDGKFTDSWVMAIDDYKVVKPVQMYLIPPDSWEKLREDLQAVVDYGNSSHADGAACHYTHTVGKPCVQCKFYRSRNCIGEMCADIAYRIRKLRGEG